MADLWRLLIYLSLINHVRVMGTTGCVLITIMTNSADMGRH